MATTTTPGEIKVSSKAWVKSILSFVLVLCTMPLGHAMMILMEHFISPQWLPNAAFAMGALGLVFAICGVFLKKETPQTIMGLIGALLLWTGWVEFLFMYYAQRFGAHPEIVNGVISTSTEYINGIASQPQMFLNGEPVAHIQDIKPLVVTRPEYLLMPASFGMWVTVMLLYIFNVRTGCNFINWCQKLFFGKKREEIVTKGMTRHPAIVTFIETMMLLWTCYLVLMFCYDPRFLGETHPVTIALGIGCLVGAFFIFRKQLRLHQWGLNIRMAIANVIVIWTPVEILGRNDMLNEIWVAPLEHITEMVVVLVTFIAIGTYLALQKKKTRGH